MTLSWIAAFCVLPTLCSAAHYPPVLYTAALIRYLADHHLYGTFDCWFYQLQRAQKETLLDELLTSQELDSIPVRVLYHTEEVTLDQHPELLLIFCDNWTQQLLEFLHNFFLKSRFKASLKIIVFYQRLHVKQLLLIQTAFTYANLFNVVFIRTDLLQVNYYLAYRDQFVKAIGVVPFEKLFKDQTVDLAGRWIYLSTSRNDPDQLVSTPARFYRGRVYEWITNTVEHYNGTVVLHKLRKDQNLYVRSSTNLYDFCLEMMSFPFFKDTYLISAYPDKLLVAAPAGRRLEVHEVFLMPFSTELWVSMIAVRIIFFALTIRFPKFLRNDILQLTIVIIHFLLCSAYEAKIITFMTNAPYAANPRTFEDLLDAGISINVSIQNIAGLVDDPRCNLVFKYSPDIPAIKYHPKVGFYARSNDILLGIVDPVSYDARTKRSRLVVLDRFPTANFIHFYYVGVRNPLKEKFRRSELTFYEAGLMDFWTRRIFRDYYGIKYLNTVSDINGPEDESLGMIHLGTIFKGLLIGLALATLVFVGEKVFDSLKRYQTKFKIKSILN